MLSAPHPHHSYFVTNDSDPTGTAGTSLTSSGSAHTYGSWTQIHAGLTYYSEYVLVNLANTFTNLAVRNAYVDIGIGPNSSNVTVLVEKLCGTGACAVTGRVYFFPLRIPPDIAIWARVQHTVASATIGIQFTVFGGNANPATIPAVGRIVCLGATTASTVGTSITVGASGAEGNWTQIVSSTTDDYSGLMIGGIFTTDTSITSLNTYSFDASIGASGQELTVGENLTQNYIVDGNEKIWSFSNATFVGIPAGSRLCVRGSCNSTADSNLSVVLYAFTH
jgi:hypothetical protein